MLKYNVRTNSTHKRITLLWWTGFWVSAKINFDIYPRKTEKFLELLRQRKRNQVACMRTSSYIPQVQLAGTVIPKQGFRESQGKQKQCQNSLTWPRWPAVTKTICVCAITQTKPFLGIPWSLFISQGTKETSLKNGKLTHLFIELITQNGDNGTRRNTC